MTLSQMTAYVAAKTHGADTRYVDSWDGPGGVQVLVTDHLYDEMAGASDMRLMERRVSVFVNGVPLMAGIADSEFRVAPAVADLYRGDPSESLP